MLNNSACGILARNRIVVTISKHVISQEALAGAGVTVGVEESAQFRVVISGLQVIEARLLIRVVAVGAKKVEISEPLEE